MILILNISLFIIYLIHFIYGHIYNKDYTDLQDEVHKIEKNLQNISEIYTQKDSELFYKQFDFENYDGEKGYWNSFIVYNITSLIMAVYLFISFLMRFKFGDYFKFILLGQIIPFLIWFISCIIWFNSAENLHEKQSDIENNSQIRDICKAYEGKNKDKNDEN